MNKAGKILLAAALAVTTSGAALAGKGSSHICAYVNDNVKGPNTAEGYMIGPGTATVHVGPYSTNGQGNATGYFAGGLGATRLQHSDLYVSDGTSDNITHFTINKPDCTLTLDPTLYPSGGWTQRLLWGRLWHSLQDYPGWHPDDVAQLLH